jgi:hypothetical protein
MEMPWILGRQEGIPGGAGDTTLLIRRIMYYQFKSVDISPIEVLEYLA